MRAPAIELVDCNNISESEWHEWRRKGIGGSDVATILGVSPFNTRRDLYYSKKGVLKPDDTNWVAKEVGHRLESLVAEIFYRKTNLKPYQINKMFQHPFYLWMLANVDYFVTLRNGKRAILECKTSNLHNKAKWNGSAVPLNYELQCRFYMAVLDIDVAFIACLFSNNDGDFVWRKIERNLDYEKDIIASCEKFWNEYIVKNVAPPYVEKSSLILASLQRLHGNANPLLPKVRLNPALLHVIKNIDELKEQKALLEEQVKAITERIDDNKWLIIEEMATATEGYVKKGNEEYSVTYKPTFKTVVDKDILKAQFSDAYKASVSEKEGNRTLRYKIAK